VSDFTIHALARTTGAEVVAVSGGHDAGAAARGATLDSRKAAPGLVFVPLPGTRADGHDFIVAALTNGATASFCARARRDEVLAACRAASLPAGATLLVVEDAESALRTWARARRENWTGELVGVAGSNGKTTTKEMLAAILEGRAPTLKTEGNLNNHLGVPVTLTRLTDLARYAVVEIGMNHAGEVRQLSQLARPTAALITGIAPEHLEGLGTLDEVARAEAEIGESLPKGAPLIVPGDEPRLEPWVRSLKARLVTFALVPGSDFVARDIEGLGEAGMRFTVDGFPALSVPVPGRHSVSNALAAIALASALGMTPAECAQGLARTARPAGRMEVVRVGGVTLLLDYYNANPGSMDAGLDTLETWPNAKRRYAALGDMLELGDAAGDYHASLGRRLNRLDGAALWGPLMARAAADAGPGGQVKHFGNEPADRKALGAALASQLAEGDVVLIKGSRGSAMEDVARVLEDRLARRNGTIAAGEGR
jgi:UDP-N-acetylmuramoyl-tripeptide--D-alanyl-D-alanine ligase